MFIDPSGLIPKGEGQVTDLVKAFGGSYKWDGNTKSTEVTVNGTTTTYTVGVDGVYIDPETSKMIVPLKLFSKNFGIGALSRFDGEGYTKYFGSISEYREDAIYSTIYDYTVFDYSIKGGEAARKFDEKRAKNNQDWLTAVVVVGGVVVGNLAPGFISALEGIKAIGSGTVGGATGFLGGVVGNRLIDLSIGLSAGDAVLEINVVRVPYYQTDSSEWLFGTTIVYKY